MLDELLQYVPAFVLAAFRIGAMMLYAPLFGSAKVPRRVKIMMTLILALAITPTIAKPVTMPDTPWQLAVGIGGEMIFGLAMGMAVSLTFIAVNWAGDIIGQQMGLNLGETFDPAFNSGGSIIGDLYFMFTLVIFLSIGGHRILIRAVRDSFDALPLMSVGMNHVVFDLIINFLHAATILAMQLAAPMLVTMLVVDISLGFIGKTMPQINVMSSGLSLRSGVGIIVIIAGITLTASIVSGSLSRALDVVWLAWKTPLAI